MKPSLKNRTDLPLAIYEPFYDVNRTIFIEAPDYAVETESTQRMALAAMAQAEGASIAGPAPMEESDSAATQDSPRMSSSVSVLTHQSCCISADKEPRFPCSNPG